MLTVVLPQLNTPGLLQVKLFTLLVPDALPAEGLKTYRVAAPT